MLSCPAFGNFTLDVSCGADRASPPRHHRPRNRAEIPIGTGDSAAADGPEAADFPPGALPNQRSATCHARSRGTGPPVREFWTFHLLLVKARKIKDAPAAADRDGHSRRRALWIIASGGVRFFSLFRCKSAAFFFFSTSWVQLTKSVGIGNRSRDVPSDGIKYRREPVPHTKPP